MNETQFRRKVVNKLKVMFPGCMILKNDPTERQGIPDVLILYNEHWAMLEFKVREERQPNQEYYVEYLNGMSFAAFISPENEEAVLNDLQSAFRSTRQACVP